MSTKTVARLLVKVEGGERLYVSKHSPPGQAMWTSDRADAKEFHPLGEFKVSVGPPGLNPDFEWERA